MDQIELGKSGVRVSPMGTGTWAWGDSMYWGYGKGYGEDDLRQAFDETLETGIDFFDTAEIYGFGKSEKFIGAFAHASAAGSKTHIATKFFPLPWRFTAGQVVSALRGSLKRLRMPIVDLYQAHWPSPLISPETVMDGMAQAVENKMTRAVGVSNYDADQVRRAHARLARYGIPLASNQIEYNLLQRNADLDGLRQTCDELGVTVIAYSPLKYGVLTGKYSPTKPLPGARGGKFNSAYLERVQPLLTELGKIAEKYDKTMPQTALNWVIQRGAIPIPGAKNLKQARDNAGALGWTLAPDDMALLDEISLRVIDNKSR